MAKKIVGFIKLQVPAGKANPSPPIGPALGQRGLNIMEFCKAFNAQTQGVEPGLPIPVVITAFADKSFTFVMKTPPATILIKKAAKVDKGSKTPHTEKVGKLTRGQAEEIAKTKMPDLTAADLRWGAPLTKNREWLFESVTGGRLHAVLGGFSRFALVMFSMGPRPQPRIALGRRRRLAFLTRPGLQLITHLSVPHQPGHAQ